MSLPALPLRASLRPYVWSSTKLDSDEAPPLPGAPSPWCSSAPRAVASSCAAAAEGGSGSAATTAATRAGGACCSASPAGAAAAAMPPPSRPVGGGANPPRSIESSEAPASAWA
eukprot:350109-Chlamydomonas_euryale.AAC.3